MALMDIPQVLEVLRPGEDWGPGSNTGNTYAELAAGWRSTTSTVPTEAEMLATWATLESTAQARKIAALRAAAQALLAATDDRLANAVRAVALAAGDGDNVLRAWVASFVAAVAASTSLADLKTRVAALGGLPQVTPGMVKTAVANRVATADADG